MLPNYVLLDVLKCMHRKGLAKIQDTTQLINNIIKQDFASKPLHVFDDPFGLGIRRNEKNEVLVGFSREKTDSNNGKCFVPSIQELQDCDTEEECWHCYPIDEMRPFMANYLRYTEVNIAIDNVDNDLPPYAPEQITFLESISHIWTGQTLFISDHFEDSIDYNLKGILGSSAIRQCHSLKLWKCPEDDETLSGYITDLQQCSFLYTLPVIYVSYPILKNDILRLIHYKPGYPQSDTTLVLYGGYISELYYYCLYEMLDALDTIKEEFLRSSAPCRLRVIIQIDSHGSTSLVQYDLLASSQPGRFKYRLKSNHTKEVLQLKQITKKEAKEEFDIVLEELSSVDAEDFQNDSFSEVIDIKALILERFTV